MKFVTLLLIGTFLTACSPSANIPISNLLTGEAVLYNGDSRTEVVHEGQTYKLAQATAVLFESRKLETSTEPTAWSLKTDPLKDHVPLCQDENFLEQPSLGFCTGVLIAPDKVLTAGHCFNHHNTCNKTQLSFGWSLTKAQQKNIPTSEVYNCKEILQHKNSIPQGIDYAIIQLDRAVSGATPVQIAKESLLKKGDSLLSLSHPYGIPLKKDLGQVLEDNPNKNLFKVAVDTFSGSSGSPLFNVHGELVGILSMGMEDILEDDIYRVQTEGGCVNFNRCANGVCFGESFFKASRIDI